MSRVRLSRFTSCHLSASSSPKRQGLSSAVMMSDCRHRNVRADDRCPLRRLPPGAAPQRPSARPPSNTDRSSGGLEALTRTGEVACREQRRGQAVLRSAAGMKTLGHRAEHFLQTYWLGGRRTERPGDPLFRKAKQLACRRGGAEHACRSGDVPSRVVVLGYAMLPIHHAGLHDLTTGATGPSRSRSRLPEVPAAVIRSASDGQSCDRS
jgi:hypothetical protein